MKLIQGAVLALLFTMGVGAQAGVRYHCEAPAGSNRAYDDLRGLAVDFSVADVVHTDCSPRLEMLIPGSCYPYTRREGSARVTDAVGGTHRLSYVSERELPDAPFISYVFTRELTRHARDTLILYVRLGAPEHSAYIYRIHGQARARQRAINCEILH